MASKLKEAAESALKYRDNGNKAVRRTVMSLLPALAAADRHTFIALYLQPFVTHLLGCIRTGNERAAAFQALGELAKEVGVAMESHLDAIATLIKKEWTAGKKRPAESLSCLAALATAVGDAAAPLFERHELLDSMFAGGLSDAVVSALVEVAAAAPVLVPALQERLLHAVSTVLAGARFQPAGTPKRPTPVAPTATAETDDSLVRLALSTLATFDLRPHLLTEFVRDCVSTYLDSDNTDVRAQAAITCAKLIRDAGGGGELPTRGHTAAVVGAVLDKLLLLGVADPEPRIRHTVLAALDARFDLHLAQPDNLRALFVALNDEVFENREVAIDVIGRLTARNPAYVMPSLRKTLIQLLTELQFSADARNKEESARLLGRLIRAADRLIRPYVAPVLQALTPKLRNSPPAVAACVLETLGELARVAGEGMLQYVDQLLPLIIGTLSDQGSAAKREAALRTLAALLQSTGYVMDPFNKYPELLQLLLHALKGEASWGIRRAAQVVLGVLGAIDPHRAAVLESQRSDSAGGSRERGAADVLPGVGAATDSFFPAAAIAALTEILRDNSLSSHHMAAIQAVMYIVRALGPRAVPFLNEIMPPFLGVLRTCETGLRDFMLQQLGELVAVVRTHIRIYLPEIIILIRDYWVSPLLVSIVKLVEEVSRALADEFKTHLPELIPPLLNVLATDRSDGRAAAARVLRALEALGGNLDDYLYLVVPAVVRLAEQGDAPMSVRQASLATLARLCRRLNVADYAARIVHPLARILAGHWPDLRKEAMDTLCALVYQLGQDFAVFVPMVNKILAKHRIQHSRYDDLVARLLKGEPLPPNTTDAEEASNAAQSLAVDMAAPPKMHVNQHNLKKAWESGQRANRDDWMDWLRRFAARLLAESPSPALRACAGLAAVYPTLARDLFNAAFVSCWTELYDSFQDELARALETAFTSPTIPPEVLQTLLNLAEFMEHDDKPLPIDIRTLGLLAEKCHAYAKALHYKEMEFQSQPGATVEALISLNNQLQQPEAAVGILTAARLHHGVALKEAWYEKLRRWDDALAAYERRQADDPLNPDLMLGRMRCLRALGEWEKLTALATDAWQTASPATREAVAPLAAASAFNLRQFDQLEEYASALRDDTVDNSWYGAVVALHHGDILSAAKYTSHARELLDADITALVGEGYKRAYKAVVTAQTLVELDEVGLFINGDAPLQQQLRRMWGTRLSGAQRSVDVWQRILAVRSMVVPPAQDADNWVKFASLCRKTERTHMAVRALSTLLGATPGAVWDDNLLSTAPARVTFACIKYMWHAASAAHDASGVMQAEQRLRRFAEGAHADPRLAARAYLRLGDWARARTESPDEATLSQIVSDSRAAADLDQQWWKAWHAWALVNYDAVTHFAASSNSERLRAHLAPAVQGFIRAIALSGATAAHTLQDTLRLLTLWFSHGHHKEVEEALQGGFRVVSIDTWLQVVPQIIARIHTRAAPVRKLVHDLLVNVGQQHPQALVYPLTVASKSHSTQRREAASRILEAVAHHSRALVDQAAVVSAELIRVAVLWHELWHDALEEASRLFYGERNPEGMLAVLAPLHDQLRNGPETLRESSFQQAFGRDLMEAAEWCSKYRRTRRSPDLNQAWDLYYHVFRRITKQLPQLTTLDLAYVSPKLQSANDLDLAVPGTYLAGQPVVRIQKFAPTLHVITSKQRPRKLVIHGSDGQEYMFLLKGHEDLRQDERAMQLLGLVNTLLATDSDTRKRDLAIRRYAVIPLAPNSGLLSWVPHCDTLHALIKEYREARRVMLNIEHRLMTQMAPDYERLTIIQKVEVFENALANTAGTDLCRVLWLKSRNSEVWLERRTNYTRSLAVMSMVGYILGLGDRHPSNLMLDQFSGKMMHIDFGDCFEVAMHREKYPEKVPFRLTRMLISAMEVSGIEGNFRLTCEGVMSVLRENKDSVMAMLEAFVHDPLINWRLLAPSPVRPSESASHDVLDGSPMRRTGAPRMLAMDGDLDTEAAPEALNDRAVAATNAVRQKLTGRDFGTSLPLDVNEQVDRLIRQATSHENLCQLYVGWCPFW
eukprot:TRINITY_DN13298_c0_g1_i1.p1 TRINITY_DN13298_c0_g1~~TRINITY_DN13298_c0_g1_i1.p1  ORF type:complete len:2319 (-),score=474.81 TRINITY_DN13298_c0_g1_i1:41-6196(-)